MKIADLYVRVSTDEQAQKWYSHRSQEAVLRQYCEVKNISVRSVIFEDHSAKTFNRPEWKKLVIMLKKYKQKTDLLLFTKWDRFSRNMSDAYQMITTLKKLGVEPQAIEQPLDLTIPGKKAAGWAKRLWGMPIRLKKTAGAISPLKSRKHPS